MELAKDCLDVGIYTDRYDDLWQFYGERLGLPYEELLKAGRGVHQHRLSLHGAVLKLNSSRDTLADAPTNYTALEIGSDAIEPGEYEDPDGTRVMVMPGKAVAVHWASSDPDRLTELLVKGFGALKRPSGRLAVGRTELVIEGGGGPVGPLRSRGVRYLTVQIRDVRSEHARLVECGWTEATAPIKLGDTAYISFVADPDGSMVEVSQRASLTGPLPD